MLRAFRQGAKGIIAKIIMGLLIVSFAVWGIGDMVVSRPGQEEVATIGKLKITRLQVENEMQRDIAQLKERVGEQYKPELLQMLSIPQQVVGRMVAQELIRLETADLGILPSDHMVAEVIRNDSLFKNSQGAFDKKIFLSMLRQNNLSEADFVKMMREDIARRLIGQAVSGSFNVPDMAVKVMQAVEKESRDVTIYSIQSDDVAISDPTDQELQGYYESVASRYAIPEYRSVSYVTLNEKDVANQLEITEEQVQTLYEERQEEYKRPETRDLDILLYTGKDDAQKAADMLKNGETPAQIAKILPPVNSTNMQLKEVSQQRLPEELQQVAFDLKEGEVSQPISSAFGFHVIKITAINEERIRELAEVGPALREEIKQHQSASALTKKATQLEDMLAGGSSLSEAAKQLGLKVETITAFNRQGKLASGKNATIPALKNFVPAAFNIGEGEASPVALGAPGTYYMVVADKVTPQILPPLSSVQDELIKSWKATRRATLQMNHARDVAGQLADAARRKELLAGNSLKKLTSGRMTRNDLKLGSVELPTPMVQSIFGISTDEFTKPSQLANGGYIIAHVEQTTLPKLAEDLEDESLNDIQSSIQANQQQELMQQFMSYLYQKYDVTIHQSVVQQIGRSDTE